MEVRGEIMNADIIKLVHILENDLNRLKDLIENENKAAPKVEAKPAVTMEQLRDGLVEYIARDAENKIRVKELLTKFGATKLSDIDPKNYEAMYVEVREWLGIPV